MLTQRRDWRSARTVDRWGWAHWQRHASSWHESVVTKAGTQHQVIGKWCGHYACCNFTRP